MAVHEITMGRSGTGKSAYAVYQLVTDWLPHLHNRNYYTNLPLKLGAIADYLVDHHPELSSLVAMDRVRLIPKDVTDRWLLQESGPWDFFRDQDLDGGRVVIDEIHNFCYRGIKKEYEDKWRKWLGEIRHS